MLGGAAGAAAALALLRPTAALARSAPGVAVRPAAGPPPSAALAGTDPALRHIAWVWQFRHDGERGEIARVLAQHGLGIALKTHDATEWMSKYDPTPEAVSGPERVAELAAYFESAGVPFHVWCVVHGLDPVREAEMAAAVLEAGARSIFIDLEPHPGFWQGTDESAEVFGAALRALQPRAWISTSIDPRPWEIDRIPLAQFAAFSDEIAPQVYWSAFDTAANVRRYRQSGEEPPAGGITPEFVLDVTVRRLVPFGLRIHPIGDGTVAGGEPWVSFIERSFAKDAESVSVWRYGVTDASIWELLAATPPRPLTYLVRAGDTLYALADTWNSDVATIVALNDIANANFLWIGQELIVPRGTQPSRVVPRVITYIVEPGDNLTLIAGRFETTVAALVELNGIANPNLLSIGQELIIP